MSFLTSPLKSLADLRVSAKIVIAFAVVLICAAALGGLAIERVNGVDAAAEEIRQHWMPRTRGLGDLLFLAQRFRTIEAAVLMADDASRPAEAKTLKQIGEQVDQAVTTQRALTQSDAERAMLASIGESWRAYLALDEQFVHFAASDGAVAAGNLYRSEMRKAIRVVQDKLNAAATENVANAQAAADRGAAIGASARRDILMTLGAAVAFCAVVGFGLWRGISLPIGALTRAMTALASGDRNVAIPALELKNEIGEMARAAHVFKEDSLNRREQLRQEAERERAAADAARESAAAERAHAHAELGQAMQQLGAALKRLASGDLTLQLDGGFAAAYAAARDDLNLAANRLREAMLSVFGCADAISIGVRQMASASDDLARRTEQQASNLESTTSNLKQITAAVRKSAESAEHARGVVTAADADARQNATIVDQAVAAMDGISKSSDHIGQIIGVIDEIAFQTNLLALNAGVEAARAGDAGKGFAVVASEVRALALRSAEAAKEIKSLIEASGREVENGVKLVGESGAALARITKEVAHINGIVSEIAQGAREQTRSLDTVAESIGEMDIVTQQNAAMVEESNAATVALAREAERLIELMRQFEVGRPAAPAKLPAAPPAKKPPPARAAAREPIRRVANGGVVAAPSDWRDF